MGRGSGVSRWLALGSVVWQRCLVQFIRVEHSDGGRDSTDDIERTLSFLMNARALVLSREVH